MVEKIIPNKEYLDTMEAPEVNTVVMCEDTAEMFLWDGESWIEHQEDSPVFNTGINLYDLNKQIISQLPSYGEKELQGARGIINEFLSRINSKFYMLLSRENNYYTVFQITDSDNAPYAASEIIDCVTFLGEIKSVGITEDEQAVEIWMQKDDNIFVAYLFDYQGAVLECRV